MTGDEIRELIAEIQRHQSEFQAVEVKTASGGTPLRAVRESRSAFSNRPGGGVVIFGLNEEAGFSIDGVHDTQRLQEDISNLAANEIVPAVHPEFSVVEIDGRSIVGLEIPEAVALAKPVYVRAAGMQGGSYIRVGLSNRRMSDYEIFGYVSAREQPTFDSEPVASATLDDLDEEKLDAYLASIRTQRGRSSYLDRPRDEVLIQLNIAAQVGDQVHPTLAGLLAFGVYPQQFEPQFVITFLHYFGIDEIEKTPRGERFLDNQKFEGTLREIIEDAVNHVLRSIRKSSLIDGIYRRDIYEYPEEAIREAVINAVAHRDYSNFVRGSYIQIRLFADRLEIQSPGGLYGNVTEETIEDEQSTRNRVLVRVLEDLRLVENRGSGIRAMIGAMRNANLEPPRFDDRRSSFWVTFHNHTLMDRETIRWLNQYALAPINDHQRVGLAYLRHNETLTNREYRRLTHVDSITATRNLRGLVQSGLCRISGSGRWTSYSLIIPASLTMPEVDETVDRVLEFVRERGEITNQQAQALLGVSSRQARTILTRLRTEGILVLEGERRGAIYRLPPDTSLG